MKDDMFEQVKYDDYDSDEEEDTDIISRIINAPTRQVKTRVFTTAFYFGCLVCKSILVILRLSADYGVKSINFTP